jgi:hypothetical protein
LVGLDGRRDCLRYRQGLLLVGSVKDDAEVFLAAKDAIDRHFDMRRVHHVMETTAADLKSFT